LSVKNIVRNGKIKLPRLLTIREKKSTQMLLGSPLYIANILKGEYFMKLFLINTLFKEQSKTNYLMKRLKPQTEPNTKLKFDAWFADCTDDKDQSV